jgi:microcystin-dependent protein
MSQAYIGEIKMMGFNFAPKGWALCNGQLMSIQQNAALFSLLGTFYGGNGVNNFQLPNMQSRTPMHWGNSAGNNVVIGEIGGTETVTLLANNLPAHIHYMNGLASAGTTASPANAAFAAHRGGYSDSSGASFGPTAVAPAGSSVPHPNVPPILAVTFCIAIVGIFPSRN